MGCSLKKISAYKNILLEKPDISDVDFKEEFTKHAHFGQNTKLFLCLFLLVEFMSQCHVIPWVVQQMCVTVKTFMKPLLRL